MENNFTIQELINEAVKREEKDKEQTSWHASSLGGCLTGDYLVRKGIAKKEFDDRTLRVFGAGRMFEDWLIGLIAKKTKKFKKQVRVEWKEMNLTGYADLVINGLVYEIKTIHSFGLKHLEKNGAKDQHKMQLWCYLKGLKKKEGRIIYLEKNSLIVKEYPLFIDDPIEKKVVEELKKLNRAWDEQLPPPPVRDPEDWRYRYCSLHGICLKQEKYLDENS